MKILIIDDSRAMQTIVKRGIDQLGYNDLDIRQADSAEAGLEIIRTWEPYLILCDWHMPGMTGLDLLHTLNRQMLKIQIGFVTTESATERKAEAMKAGAKFFVQKPFDINTLHEAVLPIIQGSTQGEEGLKSTEEENLPIQQMALPDLESLQNILSHFCKESVSIYEQKTQKISLDEKEMPYLIGLLEEPEQKRVCTVIILDIHATCILGSSVASINKEQALKAIQEKAVPKSMINNCEKLFKALSLCIYEKENLLPVSVRSVNIIRNKVDSIERILNKEHEDRVDFTLSSEKYGEGKIAIIAS